MKLIDGFLQFLSVGLRVAPVQCLRFPRSAAAVEKSLRTGSFFRLQIGKIILQFSDKLFEIDWNWK